MIEALESRRLFAVSLDFDDVLRITGGFKSTGSPKDDRIVIFEDNFEITVVMNAEIFGPFDTFQVVGIDVASGGGKDKVLCRNLGRGDAITTPVFLDGCPP